MAADCAPGIRSPAMVVQATVNEISQSEAAAVHGLATLVERMRSGQERALEELYEATVGKLYALASAILRSAEDTDERDDELDEDGEQAEVEGAAGGG